MRVFGGSYIVKEGNKQPFLAQCEDMKPTDLIQWNKKQMSWEEFIQESKAAKRWVFDDVKANPENQKQFQKLWKKIGPEYCLEKGLQYIEHVAEKEVEIIGSEN